MIKALILVHLWSLVVASGAWILQRDGGGRIGARFPASNIWLILIALSFLPGAVYLMPFGSVISLPEIEIFELLPTQGGESSAQSRGPINYLMVYVSLGLLLIAQTLWRWSRLQRLSLTPMDEPGVYTTPSNMPPLTLSWPRRAVVIPHGFEAQTALIRHERTHLHHYDAELTLLLLLLQDVMLRNPGIRYLVRQWRQSIELRADQAATKMLSASQRKDYATLLLSFQRPGAQRGEMLPCPTARLNSTPHRNAKMRLVGILEEHPGAHKRRWGAAVLLTSLAASAIGFISAAATASDAGVSPEDYIRVDYIKKTALQLPANCPGLESYLKRTGFKFEEIETTRNGELVPLHLIDLGTVVLGHDVRKDGSIHNVRILSSTLSCFEDEAKAAIAQRLAEPQEVAIKNVAVKLTFKILAENPEELNEKLKNYLR